MPVFPVMGEALLCLGLFFQVYFAATATVTLYIIDQTKNRTDFDQILKSVLRITVSPKVAEAVSSMQQLRRAPENTTQVHYVITPPQQPPAAGNP
jgi:hypothetical protein